MSYTVFELKQEVGQYYKGYLTLEKAIKVYELEHGITPEIIEEQEYEYVNPLIFEKYNLPESCNVNSLRFMKQLQDSGEVNMIIGDIRNIIQQRLLVDKSTAVEIHKCYMEHYQELYFPEELL